MTELVQSLGLILLAVNALMQARNLQSLQMRILRLEIALQNNVVELYRRIEEERHRDK